MIKKIFIGLVLLLALEVTLVIVLAQWIGLWSMLVVLLLNAAVLPFVVKRALKRLMMAPFKMKGAPLRGASVRVNAIEAAPPAPRRENDETPATPRDYVYLDITIVPQEHLGPFRHYNPSEIVLVNPNAKPIPADDDSDEVGSVESVRFWDGSSWVGELPEDYRGEQRIQLHVALAPNTARAKFRYYFEIFGDVTFPAGAAAAR